VLLVFAGYAAYQQREAENLSEKCHDGVQQAQFELIKNSIEESRMDWDDKYINISREIRLVSKFYEPRSEAELARLLDKNETFRKRVENDSQKMEKTRAEWASVCDDMGEQAFWAAVLTILSASWAGLYGFWIGLGFRKKTESDREGTADA
jgi:hypothetical protein